MDYKLEAGVEGGWGGQSGDFTRSENSFCWGDSWNDNGGTRRSARLSGPHRVVSLSRYETRSALAGGAPGGSGGVAGGSWGLRGERMRAEPLNGFKACFIVHINSHIPHGTAETSVRGSSEESGLSRWC